jgi:hypothetical protein
VSNNLLDSQSKAQHWKSVKTQFRAVPNIAALGLEIKTHTTKKNETVSSLFHAGDFCFF